MIILSLNQKCYDKNDLFRKYLVPCLFTWFRFCEDFFLFLLWTHQQRPKGIFPLPLSETAASNLCSWFPRKQVFVLGALVPRQEETGAGVGGMKCLQSGRGWMLGREWLVLWLEGFLRKRKHTAPRRCWDLERGMDIGRVVKARYQAAHLHFPLTCSQVSRKCSCRAYQPSGGLSEGLWRRGQAAPSVVTKWVNDRDLSPQPPRLSEGLAQPQGGRGEPGPLPGSFLLGFQSPS